ncbi:hypothetical protein [Staphylococcus sp. GDY8P94P]|uniref:hypothetical protein n=1 Tax=Staphylococcus sp. GDY8P94P TaxID=2804144 RepID=UPI001AEBB3BB|nr:hypothetical protein [Staphylococcus sp. GDY8P94P]
MVKIKQKKTMNLPQLIEHIWANNLRHKWKDSDNTSAYVQVYDDGQLVVDKCTKDSVFTVEVEEEITEDTKISKLAHYSVYGFKGTKNCTSINDVKDGDSIAFYIMNDDRTMTLIWTIEKGLVE